MAEGSLNHGMPWSGPIATLPQNPSGSSNASRCADAKLVGATGDDNEAVDKQRRRTVFASNVDISPTADAIIRGGIVGYFFDC